MGAGERHSGGRGEGEQELHVVDRGVAGTVRGLRGVQTVTARADHAGTDVYDVRGKRDLPTMSRDGPHFPTGEGGPPGGRWGRRSSARPGGRQLRELRELRVRCDVAGQ